MHEYPQQRDPQQRDPQQRDPQQREEHFMRRALELAEKGLGCVEPNPMVGCVLVREGNVIGQGFHQRFGGPHAEIQALDSLGKPGDARGATAFITLEPCCHVGKTPPCTEALIAAGVSRVVVAMRDPFRKVDGGGIAQLEDAGIETKVGVLQAEAERINAPYLKRVGTGRPWVIAKWAMTIDGRIATTTGESQWITSPESRTDVHQLRSRVDAIVIGMGTVAADDPMLTAREIDAAPRTATRVIMCRHRVPAIDSKLIQSTSLAPVLIVAASEITDAMLAPLTDRGARILRCVGVGSTDMVGTLLDHLGDHDATNVMIEGGGQLLASFFEADQVDECHVYVGPKVVGGDDAPGPVRGIGVKKLAQASHFELVQVKRLSDDIKLIYRRISRTTIG